MNFLKRLTYLILPFFSLAYLRGTNINALLLQRDILRCQHDGTGEISRGRRCLDLQDIKQDGHREFSVHVQRHSGLVLLYLYNYKNSI